MMTEEIYERVMGNPDPRDRVCLGCNDCDEYLSLRQLDENAGADFDWIDLGDSGVLCPKCGAEYRVTEDEE